MPSLMPRRLRLQYPGAIYPVRYGGMVVENCPSCLSHGVNHLMSRGDRREKMFVDDVDRHDFLKTVAEACQKTQWQVHAFCLMSNHYHLVVETPEPNLVPGMAWLQSTYTIRLNKRHQLIGHVFSGRYRCQIVEGSGPGYLKTACDYVHLNPVRAGLLHPEERLLAYPWSSFSSYLAAPEHCPFWIRVDRLLGEHGHQQDTAASRQSFEQRMETRRAEETDPETMKAMQHGWCLGGEAFRREMLARMEGSLGGHHAGELHLQAAQARAERLIAEELAHYEGSEGTFANRPRATRENWRLPAGFAARRLSPSRPSLLACTWAVPKQPMRICTPT